MSRAYNFQRIFNIRMGHGKRVYDKVPYRSVGPVTVKEYESRKERYAFEDRLSLSLHNTIT